MSHGPLMLDIAGTELEPEDREVLRHPAAGGVILFSRNYRSPQQVTALVEEIHALREPSLLVAVDQEGGRVQRFLEGFTRLPPAAWFGRLYDESPKRALEYAELIGWLMASELRCVGVDFSFAPVLDLSRRLSQVIDDRSFTHNPSWCRNWPMPGCRACTPPECPRWASIFPVMGVSPRTLTRPFR